MQPLDGDSNARNDDRDKRMAKMRMVPRRSAEDVEREQSNEIDQKGKPIFRAIDASAEAEQQLEPLPEHQQFMAGPGLRRAASQIFSAIRCAGPEEPTRPR